MSNHNLLITENLIQGRRLHVRIKHNYGICNIQTYINSTFIRERILNALTKTPNVEKIETKLREWK